MNTSDTLEICSNIEKILGQFGNINFLSKEDLYTLIEYIRESFKIDANKPFNVPNFCKNNFQDIITYEFHKFNDTKIGGFLIKNKFPDKSYITVNSSKEPISTLFDLTHEMMHFLLHPEDRKHYISSSLCDIDNFEWQANEGAAELLVPYKQFIPYFVNNIKNCKSKKDYIDLVNYLSNKYVVSSAIIEYRITGLKYEINQYENGIPIDKIQFLSKRAQEDQGIFITSYVDTFKKKRLEIKSIISNLHFEKTYQAEPVEHSANIESWDNFLNYLKTSGKISLYINLLHTELLCLDENTIAINFLNGITALGKMILEKDYNMRTIEKQIANMFHKKMCIKFISKSTEAIDIKVVNDFDDLPF